MLKPGVKPQVAVHKNHQSPVRAKQLPVQRTSRFSFGLTGLGDLRESIPGPPLAMLAPAQAITLRAFSPSESRTRRIIYPQTQVHGLNGRRRKFSSRTTHFKKPKKRRIL